MKKKFQMMNVYPLDEAIRELHLLFCLQLKYLLPCKRRLHLNPLNNTYLLIDVYIFYKFYC